MSPTLPNAPAVYSAEPASAAVGTAPSPIRDFLSKRGSGRLADNSFAAVMLICACSIFAIVLFIFGILVIHSRPSLVAFGWKFFTRSAWDPVSGDFGALPFIFGTLATSLLALCMAVPLALGVAVFLTELCPRPLRAPISFLTELLAAIPSVVYGLWGLFVVIPLIRPACNWLHMKMGWLPLFGTDLSGPGMLPAVIVLSIMILPTITALSRDALISVPPKIRMAAYGLGATRWETILAVILPTAARGVFGGVVLAFGRALGETMALAMLVGNANQISVSLFSPANTLAALLANAFPEAHPKEVGVLMYAALVLLGITLLVNVIGSIILQRASAGFEGAK